MKQEKKIVQTLCRMCDDRCGLNVYVENGKIVDIDGFEKHPWNKGRICSKGRAAVDMVYSPERILKPLRKTASGWQEIDLNTALDEIAEKMLQIKEKHGAKSMSIWKGEAIGFAQQEDIARRFCHAFGTPNYFSNDSLCFNGRYLGYALGYGTWAVPDYVNAASITLWGSNPPAAHPHMTRMIMEGKEKGAKLVVVDPRMSMIARQADIHARIKPGTDGALAWGLIHLLVENMWYDQKFVADYTIGFEKIREYAKRFTPDYVSGETGLDPETVQEIAVIMQKSGTRVVNYVGNGLEHHENGINNIRAISFLDALTGAFDRLGGNLHAEGLGANRLTLYGEIPLRHLGPIGADRFPVLYDYRQECHTMTGMDVILSGEPYSLRGMIVTGANPALTNPNTLKVKRALDSLDLLVVRDFFMTETAELADYLLPAASFLERSELHCHAMFQIVNLTKKVIEFPECQDEYQFWHDLAYRLGIKDYFPWENETELNRWLLEPTGVSLEELAEYPEGIRYKKKRYEKWKNQSLSTPSGKVEFASNYLKNLGFQEIPEYKAPAYTAEKDGQYPFVLVSGSRNVLYYHGRNRNIARFLTAMPGPEMEIHPLDAERIGLKDGDIVKVTSRIGSIDIPVIIKGENEILIGTVQITHGWKEANVNLLTHDDIFDPIDGFPLMKAVQVNIEKINKEG